MTADPTPLSKCKVAANSANPLVTEWPASEKAHLQSLVASQTVAVQYSGCELRIVDGCTLPGNYLWRRTTLATDTLQIDDADELYAKLPIGAIGLEGELERSGKLAVRTTVAGQLHIQGMTEITPTNPACAEATHYVAAISVGSFQLLSGSDAQAAGGVGLAGMGGGTRASRRESVLREAGSRQACDEASDEAPNSQCASPIQVFLAPLAPKSASPTQAAPSHEDQMRATGVRIAFGKPPEEDEVWTVRAPGGKVVCQVPCDAWVGPVSGYFLQREPRNGAEAAVMHLPHSFPHPVGSRVAAEFQAERGNPTLARWVFYGSIPMGAMGVGFLTWGIVQATRTCEDDIDNECFPPAGFLIGYGAVVSVMAGVGIWWHLWSREEKFDTYEELTGANDDGGGVEIMIGPGGVRGIF
jgi:hypothetical protein